MKRIIITAVMTFISFYGFAQEEDIACFSDANIDMPVLTPPLINREAFLSAELKEIKNKYNKWIDSAYRHQGLSNGDYGRLKKIGIAITDVDNSLGMTRHDSIFIDKGLIIAMANYAFAEALLQSKLLDTGIYNKWHNYLINAVIKGDPVTYATGTTIYNRDFSTLMNANPSLSSTYQGTYNSWMAFILLHEASHIILNHIEKWKKKFPGYTNANLAQWKKEQLDYSQDQELEADELFMKMYMQYAKFDMVFVLASCADWFILRECFYERKGYTLFQTHPPTKTRFGNMIRTYCQIASIPNDTRQYIMDFFNRYYDNQYELITGDKIAEVPRMRGTRPHGMDEHMERFMLRDAQLQILFTRFNNR